MKKRVLLAAVVMGLAIALLAVGGYAGDPTHDPNIQKRFDKQQMRINDGVRTGKLTKDEAALVQDNLDRIKADEAQLKAAGKLTGKEKERINKKLDMNGKMISKEKQNAIKRIE
jgi:uncharacterized protein HemX